MKKNKNRLAKFFGLTGFFFLSSIFNCHSQNVTNYTFSATSGTYTAIQGSGGSVSPALSGGTIDDGWFNSIPIGFPFTFEGTSYTSLSASTNGWLSFGNIISSAGWTNNLNTGAPRPIVAPLWDDLAMNAAGNFTYLLSGATPNRILTLEWINMKWFWNSATPGISFQVKLYEATKRIEFVYRQEAGGITIPSASIGISGIASGTFLSLNGTGAAPTASSVTETTTLNAKPATGQIYDFDKYVSQPTITNVTPLTGILGTTLTITGTNFDPLIAGNTVYLGGTKTTVTSATATQLITTVPVGSMFKGVTVTTTANFLNATSWNSFDTYFGCGNLVNNLLFSSPNFPANFYPLGIASGDLDLDGKNDVVTADSLNNKISVFLNTASVGTINSTSLAASVYFTTAAGPRYVALGDLDGDGKQDIAVCCTNVISVFRNISTIGTLAFTAKIDLPYAATGLSGYSIGIGDIDKDGKHDIVCTYTTVSGDYLSVYRNNCTIGSLTIAGFTRSDFATLNTPYELCLGDIDADGKVDVATTNMFSGSMSTFRNTSTPGSVSFSRSDFAMGLTYPVGIGMADFNADGKMDVAVSTYANFASGNPKIALWSGTSTPGTISFSGFSNRIIGINHCPRDINVNDFNGDGRPDIAFTERSNLVLASYEILNNSGYTGSNLASCFPTIDYGGGFGSSALSSADIDGDGKPECLNTASGQLVVYHNTYSPNGVVAMSTVPLSNSYCNDGTWKTYSDPNDATQIIFAVKDNGNNLGNLNVTEYEDGAPGTYNGMPFMSRHFKIVPTTQPITPVQVRLYYNTWNFSQLQLIDPTLFTIADLGVTKYDGPTEDNVYDPSDATSMTWYSQASITTGNAYFGKYLEFTVNSFSEFWIHGGTGVLPIELLNFTATPESNHVNLNWSTATETNNDYFTIEKTIDGLTYQTVATVDGAGNSTHTLNYSAIDENPFDGTSYYRLKQTDYNGLFSYSQVVAVNYVNEESQFSVFPNPGVGSVNILCPGDPTDMVELSVYDNTGKLISKSESTIQEMEHQQLNLAAGIYSIVVTRGATRFVRSLVMF